MSIINEIDPQERILLLVAVVAPSERIREMERLLDEGEPYRAATRVALSPA